MDISMLVDGMQKPTLLIVTMMILQISCTASSARPHDSETDSETTPLGTVRGAVVLGAVCGGMTSTPGLGVLTDAVDSETPAVSYAAAYPIALILMTVFSQLILRVLG